MRHTFQDLEVLLLFGDSERLANVSGTAEIGDGYAEDVELTYAEWVDDESPIPNEVLWEDENIERVAEAVTQNWVEGIDNYYGDDE